jgi:hypothetical protein
LSRRDVIAAQMFARGPACCCARIASRLS